MLVERPIPLRVLDDCFNNHNYDFDGQSSPELAQQFWYTVLHLQHGQLIQATPRNLLDWSKLRWH